MGRTVCMRELEGGWECSVSERVVAQLILTMCKLLIFELPIC